MKPVTAVRGVDKAAAGAGAAAAEPPPQPVRRTGVRCRRRRVGRTGRFPSGRDAASMWIMSIHGTFHWSGDDVGSRRVPRGSRTAAHPARPQQLTACCSDCCLYGQAAVAPPVPETRPPWPSATLIIALSLQLRRQQVAALVAVVGDTAIAPEAGRCQHALVRLFLLLIVGMAVAGCGSSASSPTNPRAGRIADDKDQAPSPSGDQCHLPVEQRTGAWFCHGTPSPTP